MIRKALCVMALLTVTTICQSQQSAWGPANLKGGELYLRETPNNNRKVYVHQGGMEFYYIHSESRLFPVREPLKVTVQEIHRRNDHTEVVFINNHLGTGKIEIYGASSATLLDAALHSAFARSIEEAKAALILNTKTGIVHFAGSNHLPPEELSEPIDEDQLQTREATPEGKEIKKCPICFSRSPQIAGLGMEMQLGEAMSREILARYPLTMNDQTQKRVRRVGEKVLGRWVAPLKGYRYKFYAIDSDAPDSFAVPGGKIYTTSALLELMESDLELEGILANEIAHVEMRHGYRQYRDILDLGALKKTVSFFGRLSHIAGSVVPGGGLINRMKQIDRINEFSAAVVTAGDAYAFEAEADAFVTLYFEANELNQGPKSYANFLRKLQYAIESNSPPEAGPDGKNGHLSLGARIDALENSEVAAFGTDATLFGYDAKKNLVATIAFQLQRNYRGTLNPAEVGFQVVALVRTTSALEDSGEIDDLKIMSSGDEIELDNREDTKIFPNDSVGISLVSKEYRQLVARIDGVELDLPHVAKWKSQ
ncbi:MAG: M48 family metalloprotease [Acidobacteriota bacterium]